MKSPATSTVQSRPPRTVPAMSASSPAIGGANDDAPDAADAGAAPASSASSAIAASCAAARAVSGRRTTLRRARSG